MIRLPYHAPFIDVSAAQRKMSHAGAAAAGVRGAWIKSTEGATYTSRWAQPHHAGFRAAGVDVGFYHYATPHKRARSLAQDAHDEAEHFGRLLSRFNSQLRPILDYEERWSRDRDVNTLWALEFAAALANHTDAQPAIYCGASFWRNRFHPDAIVAAFGPPIIAEYPWGLTHKGRRKRAIKRAAPRVDRWAAWQWTSRFRAPWTGGRIDLIAVRNPCEMRA